MDAAISKVILGHASTTDSTAGKLGGDNMASEVRSDITAADADLICSSFNQSVVKWLCEWNFPGAAQPKVWREVEEAEDLKSRVDRDKVIYDMGYKPTLKYVTETYDMEVEAVKPPAQPPTDSPSADATATPDAAFAEADSMQPGPDDVDPTPVSAMTDQLATEAGGAFKTMIDQITALVDQADSLEALSAKLLDGYGGLDSDELSNVMALGFAAAELAGRFDVSEGG